MGLSSFPLVKFTLFLLFFTCGLAQGPITFRFLHAAPLLPALDASISFETSSFNITQLEYGQIYEFEDQMPYAVPYSIQVLSKNITLISRNSSGIVDQIIGVTFAIAPIDPSSDNVTAVKIYAVSDKNSQTPYSQGYTGVSFVNLISNISSISLKSSGVVIYPALPYHESSSYNSVAPIDTAQLIIQLSNSSANASATVNFPRSGLVQIFLFGTAESLQVMQRNQEYTPACFAAYSCSGCLSTLGGNVCGWCESQSLCVNLTDPNAACPESIMQQNCTKSCSTRSTKSCLLSPCAECALCGSGSSAICLKATNHSIANQYCSVQSFTCVKSRSHLGVGAVFGILFGILIGIMLIGAMVFFLRQTLRRRPEYQPLQ